MIRSMTGFGAKKFVSETIKVAVEIKSVNNRYLDISIKMPRIFYSFEEKLRSLISSCISRGKVDVFITIDTMGSDDIEVSVNHHLAKSYIQALSKIAWDNDLKDDVKISDILRIPDILQANRREQDLEELASLISDVLSDALTDFDLMRTREGEKLGADITARLDEIERLTSVLTEISPRNAAEYRKKLETKLSEVLSSASIDESRILTEAAIFAEKTAIDEELIRLSSHIHQLRSMLCVAEPVGRKIDFLIQEFNREANTIGSKGNDIEVSKIIIDLKSEIEKIREQSQNIE